MSKTSPSVWNRATNWSRKLKSVFARYPAGAGIHPKTFQCLGWSDKSLVDGPVLALQLVPDRFHFLLFGAICVKLQNVISCKVELVAARAISGAIGTGWVPELKRSALAAFLFNMPWIRAYGAMVNGLAYRSSSYRHPIQDWRDWKESKLLWSQIQAKDADFSLRMGGVEVADLLVDSYLRFKPSPFFDAADPFVRRLIWQALRDVRRASQYFRDVKPAWYISSYSTYLEHGIAVRVALKHQVPVWTFGNLNQFGKRLSVSDSFHTIDFSEYRSQFDALEGREARLLEARKMLEKRLSGSIDAATSYMRKSAYANTDATLPPGLNGAVVVFLHDFYDSPHVYPDLVFQDFWRWICFTIEVLEKEQARFFLKPHPNQIALSDEVLPALRRKFPRAQWISSSVNNVQLVEAGIACGVTVYGTVAHELAYLGVPSICCARHPHYTFDFCRTARNQEEYADMLRSFDSQPLGRVQMQEQALSFFYMHNLYGTPDQIALKNALVTLWKSCGSKDTTESDIMNMLLALTQMNAFKEYVQTLDNCRSESGSSNTRRDLP